MSTTRYAYATQAERFFAYLIDTLILGVPGAILYKLFGEGGMTLLLGFLCNVAYYTYFTASIWQATPGKRLLGIHVIRTDGRKLVQANALERFLVFIMPSLPMYLSFLPENTAPILTVWLSLFWFSPILYTPGRVGLHDRICETRVVVGKVDA